MICPYCAAEMPEISSYCPSCGRSVHSDSGPISTTDRQESLLAALAYLTIIPAIAFLLIPKTRSKSFIRFHAWQSILFAGAAAVVGFSVRVIFAVLSFVPIAGFLFAWLAAGLAFLAIVILWAVLVVKTGQGQAYELPWLGHFAAKLTNGSLPEFPA